MTTSFIAKELDLVFGPTSVGDTPEERATTSSVKFVRSQIQLAPYSEGATGRVLSVRKHFVHLDGRFFVKLFLKARLL